MPRPSAINRQLLRSSFVACDSRGYQARGAEMLRPSESSTESVLSVEFTLRALGICDSVVLEVLIPILKQLFAVLLYESFDSIDFSPAEAVTSGESRRTQPELCLAGISFDVDMRRFITVARVEEQSVGAAS